LCLHRVVFLLVWERPPLWLIAGWGNYLKYLTDRYKSDN
jgi:hypothetical protein